MFIIKANEGQRIQVGDRFIRATSVIAPGVVQLEVEGEAQPVTVSWDRKLDLFPGVRVTLERGVSMAPRIKFMFDAPRSVKIRELPDETGP